MTAGQPQPSPLWRAIRLDDHHPPSEPPTEAVRLGVRTWWRQFIRRQRPYPALPDQPPELTSAPANLLNYLLPRPDWNQLCSPMLASALAAHDFDASPCAVVVMPTYCTAHDALLAWATAEHAVILPAPTPTQILEDPHSWFTTWPDDPETPVVVSALECCYLRHQRGLGLIRQLIENLYRQHRRSLVICDSWAWTFLAHACPTNLLSTRPWTAAPLEAEELEQLFVNLTRQAGGEGYAFRRVDNGKPVLRMVPADEEEYSDEFLTHLAAFSRGNPVVAWEVWRRSLLVSAQMAEQEVDDDVQDRGNGDPRRPIWVQRWSKMDKPQLIFPVEDHIAFVLHTLLLHNGLTADLLYPLLPNAPIELARTVRDLYATGVIQEVNGEWRVTPAAYPEVRRGLAQQGFLVDDL